MSLSTTPSGTTAIESGLAQTSPGKSAMPTRIGLVAGEGKLPLQVAKNAVARGIEVIPFMVGNGTRELRDACKHKGHKITPGLLRKTYEQFVQEGVTHLVFAGKVNKWILLKDPRVDDLAVEAIRRFSRLNDDAVMLWIIEQLEQRGVYILPQSDFLEEHFLSERLLSTRRPDDQDMRDVRYGFEMAKEMGRLDVGQSIVVRSGMIVAVEAIEGTDECLKRAGKLCGKKGGVVVKVAKPGQDQRFDIPTVGLRTLKTMKAAGLHMLVTEAGHTLYLEPEEMAAFADRHNMILLSTADPGASEPVSFDAVSLDSYLPKSVASDSGHSARHDIETGQPDNRHA